MVIHKTINKGYRYITVIKQSFLLAIFGIFKVIRIPNVVFHRKQFLEYNYRMYYLSKQSTFFISSLANTKDITLPCNFTSLSFVFLPKKFTNFFISSKIIFFMLHKISARFLYLILFNKCVESFVFLSLSSLRIRLGLCFFIRQILVTYSIFLL